MSALQNWQQACNNYLSTHMIPADNILRCATSSVRDTPPWQSSSKGVCFECWRPRVQIFSVPDQRLQKNNCSSPKVSCQIPALQQTQAYHVWFAAWKGRSTDRPARKFLSEDRPEHHSTDHLKRCGKKWLTSNLRSSGEERPVFC